MRLETQVQVLNRNRRQSYGSRSQLKDRPVRLGLAIATLLNLAVAQVCLADPKEDLQGFRIGMTHDEAGSVAYRIQVARDDLYGVGFDWKPDVIGSSNLIALRFTKYADKKELYEVDDYFCSSESLQNLEIDTRFIYGQGIMFGGELAESQSDTWRLTKGAILHLATAGVRCAGGSDAAAPVGWLLSMYSERLFTADQQAHELAVRRSAAVGAAEGLK